MKSRSLLLGLATCCLALFLGATSASAQSTSTRFSIDLLGTGREYLFVDKGWEKAADCIEAKVSVKEDTPFEGVALKAYFYSADGKLLHTELKPSSQADPSGGTIKPPAAMKAGRKVSFCFGIPQKIRDGSGKWKRAIVVFGNPAGGHDVKIYPKDDLAKFDFPEKAALKK